MIYRMQNGVLLPLKDRLVKDGQGNLHAVQKVYGTLCRNLFDESLIEVGGLGPSTGLETTDETRRRSGFISVEPSTTYCISRQRTSVGSYFWVIAYDVDKNIVTDATVDPQRSGVLVPGSTYTDTQWVMTTTPTTKYIRWYVTDNGSYSNIMLNLGSTALPYEPFVKPIAERTANGFRVDYKTYSGSSPLSFTTINTPIGEYEVEGKSQQEGTPGALPHTLSFGTIIQNSYVNNTDGVIAPYNGWDRTDYMSIPEGMKSISVAVDSTYNNKYNCWYDENKNFISSFTIWNASSGTKILTANVPSGAKYVIFSGPTAWVSSAVVTYNTYTIYGISGVGDYVSSGDHVGKYAVPITCAGSTQTLYLNTPLYGNATDADYIMGNANGSGVEYRAFGVIVLTGSEEIKWQSSAQCIRHIANPLGSTRSLSTNYVLCDHYKNHQVTDSIMDDISIKQSTVGGTAYLFIRDTRFADHASYASYLAEQYAAGTPVTIIYPLASPTKTQISLPRIVPNKGSNSLSVGTTISPLSVSVKAV